MSAIIGHLLLHEKHMMVSEECETTALATREPSLHFDSQNQRSQLIIWNYTPQIDGIITVIYE